jgi:alpha-tubulin suppressor-like RCC1 family protein
VNVGVLQIGNGTNSRASTPVDVTGLSGPIMSVEAGDSHVCAATGAGVLKCWGSNAFGQIGDGTAAMHLAPVGVMGLSSGMVHIAAGGMHSCAVTDAGGVKCWGNNHYGQLGDGTTVDRMSPVDVFGLYSGVATVTVGDFHSCALLTSGALKCWGYNLSGQLGDGSNTTHWLPVDVEGMSYNIVA